MQYTTNPIPFSLIGQSHKSGILMWGSTTATATMISNISGMAPMADYPVMQALLVCIGVALTIWAQKAESEGLRTALRDVLSEASDGWIEAHQILGHRHKFESSRQYRHRRAGKSRV
mgnify:CR=1 FL=1